MNKKIYYWSPFFSNIATTRAVMNSAISFKKFSKEYDPIIIDVFGEWNNYRDSLKKEKITIKKLGLDNFFKEKKIHGYFKSRYYQIKIFILAFIPLLKLIKKNKPDYLIVHLVTSLPLLLNFFFNLQSKIILRISGFPKLNIVRNFFWQIVFKKTNIITAPTEATMIHLKNRFNLTNVYLIRDPILNIKNIKFKRQYKKDDKKNFITIGRLTKQKNFLFLLQCFKKIIEKNPKIYLSILGEGEEYKKLKNFLKINNLEKNIFLKGFQNNVFDYLVLSDAFILSSLWEDPGFVLVEAAYSNTTIISSNCPNGPAEILEDGKNGFLFKSNDKENFFKIFENFEKSKISSIYKKKLRAKKMSKKYSLFNHFIEFNKIL